MIELAVTILTRLWPYILGAALLGIGYYKADHWQNAAYREANARATTLQAEKDAAQKRATDLALLWAGNLDKHDKDLRDEQAKAAANFARLADDARHLSPLPTLVISGAAWSVLDAATFLANAAGPAPEHHDTPETISESALTGKWNEAAAAYADARQKWASCVTTYQGFQHEQNH